MKFKEALLRELHRRGITTIFGVPGRENEKIFLMKCQKLNILRREWNLQRELLQMQLEEYLKDLKSVLQLWDQEQLI